jgi:hypothetical protein
METLKEIAGKLGNTLFLPDPPHYDDPFHFTSIILVKDLDKLYDQLNILDQCQQVIPENIVLDAGGSAYYFFDDSGTYFNYFILTNALKELSNGKIYFRERFPIILIQDEIAFCLAPKKPTEYDNFITMNAEFYARLLNMKVKDLKVLGKWRNLDFSQSSFHSRERMIFALLARELPKDF